MLLCSLEANWTGWLVSGLHILRKVIFILYLKHSEYIASRSIEIKKVILNLRIPKDGEDINYFIQGFRIKE